MSLLPDCVYSKCDWYVPGTSPSNNDQTCNKEYKGTVFYSYYKAGSKECHSVRIERRFLCCNAKKGETPFNWDLITIHKILQYFTRFRTLGCEYTNCEKDSVPKETACTTKLGDNWKYSGAWTRATCGSDSYFAVCCLAKDQGIPEGKQKFCKSFAKNLKNLGTIICFRL